MIQACNENTTTMETVDTWSVMDYARRYCLMKAEEMETPDQYTSYRNQADEYLRLQQHIERIVHPEGKILTPNHGGCI